MTLCNDVERTEIKKLNRKLGHAITPYTIQAKSVQRMFDVILQQLDHPLKQIQLEEASDKEIQKAMQDARRAENMIRYREEIANRPKNVWLKTEKQKKDLKDKSK